jgi:hypothetical protein
MVIRKLIIDYHGVDPGSYGNTERKGGPSVNRALDSKVYVAMVPPVFRDVEISICQGVHLECLLMDNLVERLQIQDGAPTSGLHWD